MTSSFQEELYNDLEYEELKSLTCEKGQVLIDITDDIKDDYKLLELLIKRLSGYVSQIKESQSNN
ncbi:hypothetical protein DID75_01495 [Candidatus Marinamargulisbacteria bacterium SCGC AG-410-N11]|nr:hypothetical protein DID75_01495 [Candidatus Marinamargulisbacteria bacterium SCGC AG-410-N11]